MVKNLILGLTMAHLAQIWAPHFFSWILLLQVARHCFKLSSYAILKKTNEPNLNQT